jgi:hypothetical protein
LSRLLFFVGLNEGVMAPRKENTQKTSKNTETCSTSPGEISSATPKPVDGEKTPKRTEPLIVLPLKKVLNIVPLYYDIESCVMSETFS